MRTVLATAAALFLFASGDALADWHEASSDHFVIYADESEKSIRKYSDRLAREVAAKYPDEPAVQAALAEAEFDVGDDEAAIRAADKALAAAPGNMTALIQKGYALTRMATETKADDAWRAARRHFVSVNKLENDHPIPLIYFYLWFVQQGKEPSKVALQGLEWALELAPYDASVRMMVASRQMEDERFADAIRTISPLAYNPHLGTDNPAIALLEKARAGLAAQAAPAAAAR